MHEVNEMLAFRRKSRQYADKIAEKEAYASHLTEADRTSLEKTAFLKGNI